MHCRVYLFLLTEFSHLQKLTFLFQQHWSQHGERRRAQCGSENANCCCSQELKEVKGHILAIFGSCFDFSDHSEEILRVSDGREP